MSESPIYLDHSATTPVDPAVVATMQPYWSTTYGNPSSLHEQGRQAARGLAAAREALAAALNAHPDEIIFTGCGSESDNLAIRGVLWAARQAGRGHHVITSAVEHEAVRTTCEQLAADAGFAVTVLPVDGHGLVDVAAVAAAIRPDTALISIMAANNEFGTVQPIEAIGTLARDRGVLFHSDAIQAAAFRRWDMAALPIDLLSLAPHKFYGPKGIGVLVARRGVELAPTLTGGGQEAGRRAGTSNVAFAVGAAEAFRLAMDRLDAYVAHCHRLRDRLIHGLLAALGPDIRLTGHPTERLPHHASFAVRGAGGNDLLMHLDAAGICASSGSACASGDPRPSAALEAMGLGPEWTRGGLRLTVGWQNSPADIDRALEATSRVVRQVQALAARFAVGAAGA